MQSFGGRIDVWVSHTGEPSEPNISCVPGDTLVGRIFMVPTGGALLMLHVQSLVISPE